MSYKYFNINNNNENETLELIKDFLPATTTADKQDDYIDISVIEGEVQEDSSVKKFFNFVKETYIDKIKSLVLVLAGVILIYGFFVLLKPVSIPSSLSIKSNLVSEHFQDHPSWGGLEFTPRLTKAIQDEKIDLFGITVIGNSEDETSFRLEETSEAVPGTAECIQLVKAEYIERSDEELESLFSKEYIQELKKEGKTGYWNFTIDLKY